MMRRVQRKLREFFLSGLALPWENLYNVFTSVKNECREYDVKLKNIVKSTLTYNLTF